jgi:predicted nucleotidyltransferase
LYLVEERARTDNGGAESMSFRIVIMLILGYTINMGRYEAQIPAIKEQIVKEFQPEKIILFGSYAWGIPTSDSDVDLFIIKNSTESRRKRQIDLRMRLFGSGVPMDLLVYTPEEIQKRLDIEDPFILHILKSGKVLYQA